MPHAADVIIIGGGISGLATAWHVAQRGRRALVLERRDQLGGALCSAATTDGYWYELGAHTCYNSYGGLLELLEQAGRLDGVVPRQKAPFRLLVDGALRGIGKELSFTRALLSLPRMIGNKKPGKTVRQYFGRIVGAKNYARVLGPMLAAVPSQVADDLPADMLFKKRPRRKEIARSYTLDGGLGSVADAVSSHELVETRVGVEVAEIAEAEDGWTARTTGGVSLRAPRLALAVSPSVGAQLMQAPRPELAAALARIDTATVHSVGYVLPRSAIAFEPVAGIVPRDADVFWSAVSRDVVPDERYRAFTFHFKSGLDAAARDARASEVLGVDVANAVHRAETTTELPAPRLGHHDIVASITQSASDDRLAVAGNFFAGLAIEDCVQRAADVATQLTPNA